MVKAGSLWLLLGKDDFLKDEAVRELRKKVFPPGSDPSDYQEFSGSSQPAASALDFVRTAPFLGTKRMAVLRDLEELDADEKTFVEAAAVSLPSWAALVLVAGDGDARKDAFLKKLSEAAEVVSCRTPYDEEFPGWIEARARKAGAAIDRAATRVLLERLGKDPAALSQAAEQLALYVMPRKRIEEKDVEALIGRSLQSDVFKLVDAVLEGRTAEALSLTESLMAGGTKPYEILAVLGGQIERLRRGVSMLERGTPSAEIARELKVHPYFTEKFVRQATRARGGKAARLSRALLSCDESIKSGRADETRALEKAVLELCA